MKTINLSNEKPSVRDLIEMARTEGVLLFEDNGDNFLLTLANDFETEVELLRRSHKFLSFLNQRLQSTKTIPIEQVEAELLNEENSIPATA
jgi:hypothetical protein